MHRISEPAILYFGTPVVLVSTVNENGTFNIAPVSSVFWPGWRCIIGLGVSSKTFENIVKTKQCVLNRPSVNEAKAVDRLALTTGSYPMPESKRKKGYRYEPDKFAIANLTPECSDKVAAPRIAECPVQLEYEVMTIHTIGDEDLLLRGRIATIELKIVNVYLEESILMDGHSNKIDPDKWQPLIMNFQKFYGLGEQVHASTLSRIPEQLYKHFQGNEIKTA